MPATLTITVDDRTSSLIDEAKATNHLSLGHMTREEIAAQIVVWFLGAEDLPSNLDEGDEGVSLRATKND